MADTYGAGAAGNNVWQSVTGTLQGSAQYVISEVLVGMLFQKITGIGGRRWANSSIVHTLSLPLQGAFQAPMSAKDYKGWDAETSMELVWQGLYGVPAYIVAGYIADMSYFGFHLPKINKELFMGIFSKIMTRPIVGNLLPYLPTTVQEAQYVLDAILQDMRKAGTWVSSDTSRRRVLY